MRGKNWNTQGKMKIGAEGTESSPGCMVRVHWLVSNNPAPSKNSITWETYDLFLKVDHCLFHFCRMSTRIISVYDSRNLSETLSTLEINIAPSVLIPFYDEDSAVLFLSSKVGIFTECKLRWSYLQYCPMQK